MPIKLNTASGGGVILQGANTASDKTITIPAADGNMQLIQQATAVTASGTSVDFTGIPSWAKRVTVMYSGLSSNGTSDFLVRLGTGAGFVTSGYLGSSMLTGSGAAAASYTTGFGINQNAQGTTFVGHGAMTISLLNPATNMWVASGTMGESDAARGCYTGGSVTISGTLDRVRITTVNGTDTFDAGTINIMYEG